METMMKRTLTGFPKSKIEEKGRQLLPFQCGELPVLGVPIPPPHLSSHTALLDVIFFSVCSPVGKGCFRTL